PILDRLTNKEKGDIFEILSYYLFRLSPILNTDLQNIWLYANVPEEIRDELLLPKKDKGIDLLIKRNGRYQALQCKWRQNYQTIVPWKELSTFYGLSFGLHDKIEIGYFITNTYDMCDEVINS